MKNKHRQAAMEKRRRHHERLACSGSNNKIGAAQGQWAAACIAVAALLARSKGSG